MKRMSLFISVVLVAIVMLTGTWASAREIVILGNDYKIPKIYLEDGTAKGILIDIARYIDQQMEDYTFTFQLYPWARAYHQAVAGEGGIIGLSKTPERLTIFDYSDVIYYDDVLIVVKRGREFPFETITDLKGKVVGIGREGTFGGEFEEARQSGLFIVKEDDGPVMRLRKLLRNRIDCALISPGIYAFHQTIAQNEELQQHKDDLVVLPKPLTRDPNYLGFAKTLNMQPFLEKFNAILNRGYENGEIPQIIEQYTKE